MNLLELNVAVNLEDNATPKIEQMSRDIQQGAGFAIGGGIVNKASQAADALIGFATDSVQVGANFDQAMAQVAATGGMTMEQLAEVTGKTSTAYGDFEGNLRDFAKFMGSNTAFSATQAAEGLNYMALAGYDAQTSMDMLPSVLNLAAAGALDLGDASDMLTDVQSALGLSLEDTNTLVDQMAAAAANSNTSVGQLGAAMLQVGGTAKDMSGGTLEIATALGIMANNGIKGAEGGTALRNILLSLTPKSDDAAAAMENLGIEFYDAQGNIRPLNESFSELSASLNGMSTKQKTETLSAIFNKVDLKAVSALLANTTEGVDTVTYSLMGLIGTRDDSDAYWESIGMNLYETGNNFDTMDQAIYDSLDETGRVTEQTRQTLLDMGLSSEQVEFIMTGLADTVMGQTSSWSNLEGAIDASWYTIDSLTESLSNAGVNLDDMTSHLGDLGLSADEVQIAFDACNGDAQLFLDGLGEMGTQVTTQDELLSAMGITLDDLQTAFDNTTGAAQQMADTQLDQLLGDTTLFQSALEGLQIALFDKVSPALREVVQGGSELISGLTALVSGDQASADKAFEALGERIGNAWESITTGIQEILPSLTTFFTELPGNIGTWVGDTSRTLVAAGSDFIGGLIGGASGDGGESPLVTFFAGLPATVAGMITDAGSALQQAGRDLIAGLLFGTTEVSDGELMQKVSGLPGEFVTWMGATGETLQQTGRDIIAGLLFGTTEVSDGELQEKISNLPSDITAWLEGVGETLQQRGRELIAGLLFGTTDVTDGELMTAMTELPGKILGFIGDTASTLFNTGVDFLTGFYVGVSEILNGSLKEDMSNFLGTVGGFIGSAISSLWQVGVDFITGFFTGAGDEKDKDGESTFGNILELAKAWMQAGIDVATFLGELGTSLISGFLDGVSGGKWTEIKEWFADLPNNVVKEIGDLGQTLLDAGKSLINGFAGGIKDIFGVDVTQPDTVMNMVSGIPQMIVDALGDLGQTLWQCGVDLVNGLTGGIQAFIDDPAGVLLDGINGLISGTDETIDANSPSKVFEKRGNWIVEGLENGINGEGGIVDDALLGIANGLPANFADAYWAMHDMGAGLMTSFNTGMTNVFNGSVLTWLSSVGSMMRNWLGVDYYTFWDAAQNAMVGFGDALVRTFNSYVAPTLQSITNAIPTYKGPLEKDLHLLEDNGDAIMQGLLSGIRSGSQDVYEELGSITANIQSVDGSSGTTQPIAAQGATVVMADAFRGANISFRNREDMEEFSEMLADHIARETMGRYAIA